MYQPGGAIFGLFGTCTASESAPRVASIGMSTRRWPVSNECVVTPLLIKLAHLMLCACGDCT